jgi:hypothetical protein
VIHPYSSALIATETVRERQLTGERLARLLGANPVRAGRWRRVLARLAASASRAAAAVAVRLDDGVPLSGAPRSPSA